MAATRRNLFLRSKMKTNRSLTNSFSNPKEKVSNLEVFFKKRADKILHLNRHEIAPDGRQQGDEKIGFSTFFIVEQPVFRLFSLHSSRKSIEKNLEITKSVLYINFVNRK
jgi:hypothetical protein